MKGSVSAQQDSGKLHVWMAAFKLWKLIHIFQTVWRKD